MEDLKSLALLLIGILVAFTVVMTMVAYTVLAERRILGFIQGRLGPNRVGPGGFLQPLADLLKFIFKEDIVPDKSTRFVYFLAPVIATTAALMTIVVYPFGPDIQLPVLGTVRLVVARFDVALLYVLGVTSVGVYGIALAGWSSNNKYSLMGGLRSSAQMISYELALGLGLIGVILQSGTLDLYSIVVRQHVHGFDAGDDALSRRLERSFRAHCSMARRFLFSRQGDPVSVSLCLVAGHAAAVSF